MNSRSSLSIQSTLAYVKIGNEKIILLHREQVKKSMEKLHSMYGKIICKKFNIRYSFLCEEDPGARKAGKTVRQKGNNTDSNKIINDKIKHNKNNQTCNNKNNSNCIYNNIDKKNNNQKLNNQICTIYVKFRDKNDYQRLLSESTQIAVFLHELAHLKYMNHKLDFAKFLRNIYAYCNKQGIFCKNQINEIKSPWEWERQVFIRAGDISDDELQQLFDQG